MVGLSSAGTHTHKLDGLILIMGLSAPGLPRIILCVLGLADGHEQELQAMARKKDEAYPLNRLLLNANSSSRFYSVKRDRIVFESVQQNGLAAA